MCPCRWCTWGKCNGKKEKWHTALASSAYTTEEDEPMPRWIPQICPSFSHRALADLYMSNWAYTEQTSIHCIFDCRRPLLVEDCQHYGRTRASLMMHCASFMMHNDTQCDFGNFEALADFKRQKYGLDDFLGHFIIWMMHNDAQCIIVHHLWHTVHQWRTVHPCATKMLAVL